MASADPVARNHDEQVRQVLEAVKELPTAAQDSVRERLVSVAVTYNETKVIDPVVRFLESLLMTARLHRNPAYRKSLEEADEAVLRGEPSDPMDISAMFAQMRERRA